MGKTNETSLLTGIKSECLKNKKKKHRGHGQKLVSSQFFLQVAIDTS